MGRSTADVADLLRSEGFSISPDYIAWVLRARHIAPPESRIGLAYAWTDEDIQRLKGFLIRRGRAPQGECRAEEQARSPGRGGYASGQ